MKFLAAHSIAGILLAATVHAAHAAHPLITDDTGTQGTGNSQIEINTDWARNAGATERVGSLTYTYGATPLVDLYLNVPGTLSKPSGVSDASLGVKWRFFENEGTSYALNSALLLPSGDADKELGNGRAGMALTMLASKEVERWTFHGNLGVAYQRYKLPAAQQSHRQALWSVSAAAAYQATEQVSLVSDIGVAQNADKSDRTKPAFFLVGAIYSPTPDLDLDLGWKLGLNHAEADRQLGVGLTFRF